MKSLLTKTLHALAVIILFTIIFAGNCRRPFLAEIFYGITVHNDSGDSICPFLAQSEPVYPDTSLPSARPALVTIAPGRSFTFDSRKPWEDRINSYPSDTISLFIFDDETYKDSAWSTVRNNYRILKRYDLSAVFVIATGGGIRYQ